MSHMINPLQVSGSGWTPAPFTAHISEKEVSELKSKQDIKKVLLTVAFYVNLKMLIARSAMGFSNLVLRD